MNYNNFILLIPCLNESKTILKILNQIKKHKFNYIVIDNNSEDSTLELLISNNINFKINRIKGYEETIIFGFNYIIKNFPSINYIVTFDADGEHELNELNLFQTAMNSNCELIIGNRKRKNRLLENIMSYFFLKFFKINDPLSGFKAYSTQMIRETEKIRNDLFLTDIILNNLDKKIINIEISSPKRMDNSRIGSFTKITLKLLKILIISIKVKTKIFFSA